MNDIFHWAIDFVLDAYEAGVMWFGVLMNELGAFGWLMALFTMAVIVMVFIVPIRGFGWSGAIPAGSASTRNYGSKGLPSGGSDGARRKK